MDKNKARQILKEFHTDAVNSSGEFMATATVIQQESMKEVIEAIGVACKVMTNYKDAVNELCYKCGRYEESYLGACDGCRWENEK